MLENREKRAKTGQLFEISASTCKVLSQRYGISLSDIAGPMRRGDLYKARILFAGILAAFEVPTSNIARLLHKTTDSIEGYVAEYNSRLSTNTEYQQITKEVKDSLTSKV